MSRDALIMMVATWTVILLVTVFCLWRLENRRP
jgi:hypothetical protein